MNFLISFLFPMPLMHALPFPAEGGREREREGWCARTKGIGKNISKQSIMVIRINYVINYFQPPKPIWYTHIPKSKL
jgi:hypothetical protein